MTSKDEYEGRKIEKERKQQEARRNRIVARLVQPEFIIQFLLVLCTGGLIIVGVMQKWTLDEQREVLDKTDKTLKDTLAANNLEQRPWIFPVKFEIYDETPRRGLIIKDGMLELSLNVVVRNTGKLPAIQTFYYGELFLFPPGRAFNLSDFTPIKGCDQNSPVGVSVFPQADVALLPTQIRNSAAIEMKGSTAIAVGSCIRFKIPGDDTPKRLRFWHLLMRIQDKEHVYDFPLVPHQIFANDLRLHIIPSDEKPE